MMDANAIRAELIEAEREKREEREAERVRLATAAENLRRSSQPRPPCEEPEAVIMRCAPARDVHGDDGKRWSPWVEIAPPSAAPGARAWERHTVSAPGHSESTARPSIGATPSE
jgi:hypothetical protein